MSARSLAARSPDGAGVPRWSVYMLECAGGRIYTGIALDVAARFAQHCSGHGAAFTRINKPVRILAAQGCGSRSEALKAEYALKQLPRPEKLRWVRQRRWKPRGTPAVPPRRRKSGVTVLARTGVKVDAAVAVAEERADQEARGLSR